MRLPFNLYSKARRNDNIIFDREHDRTQKQQQVTPEVAHLVTTRLSQLYARLETAPRNLEKLAEPS